MQILFVIILLVTGSMFIGSVMLMSPKWGLWFGIGGMTTSNEYGSKKSLEGTLKKSACITGIVFVLAVVIFPYLT